MSHSIVAEDDHNEVSYARKLMKKLNEQSRPIPMESGPINENMKPKRGVSMLAADGKLIKKGEEKDEDINPSRQTRSRYMESRLSNGNFGPKPSQQREQSL